MEDQTKPENVPSYADRVAIAAKAGVDPTTVARYFRGGPIRSTTKLRIQQALAAMGHPTKEGS